MGLNTGKRALLIYWITLLICGTILFYGNVFELNYLTVGFAKPLVRSTLLKNVSPDNFTINTPGCKIPYMDAFDNNIRKFLDKSSKPICNKGRPSLVASNLTSIFLLKSSLSSYKIKDLRYLECCYRPFWRIAPRKGKDDKEIELSSTCHFFQDEIDIRDEFIKVTCKYNSTSIYVDTFSFVPLKNQSILQLDPNNLNVLVFGLDGVSRLNLHRQLPKTVKYLKENGAVELLGYNKVADNTFPNLIPVLTGLTEKELKSNCWPKVSGNLDDCPFVWKLYKEKGHLTAFGEDTSWLGLFHYQRKGFKNQSTDYYYSYFNRFSEDLIGNVGKLNSVRCVGSRLVYKELLDYTSKFVTTMDNNNLPYFSFFWEVSISHDYLNFPQVGDDDYLLFFKTLLEGNRSDNTVLIFMSDHGIRYGKIRETFQGKMEERLPFVFLSLPKPFQMKYNKAFKNLVINTKRLTTPFDLHETLIDLINPGELLLEHNLKNANQPTRGISLFKPITDQRTCQDAGISDHWCTCTQSKDVEINGKVLEAAKFTVKNINSQLKGYAQCAKLTLDTVIDAKLVWNPSIKGDTTFDYFLTFSTLPGKAVFEATLSHKGKNSFKVEGSISRLNLYGNQSSCITDFNLKLYCYCVSLLL